MVFATAPILAVAKRVWKPVAIVVAIGAAWWTFDNWRDNLIKRAKAEQHQVDEAQYSVAIDAANKIAAHDNSQMTLFATAFGALASQRTQAIDLKVQPQIERIQNEVASDPRYRDCRVSDSVLDAANAARATVDADIAASNPK